jgi:hypothetical protein
METQRGIHAKHRRLINVATRKGKGWHPTQTRNAWVPVGKLNSLQIRKVNPRKVAKFVRDLDPDAIGNLYVSQRKDGSLWVIDGNNRREAIHRLWGPEAQVPCLIYSGLTYEEERLLFVKYNEDRTKPRPIDIFIAKVEGKDPRAVAIAEIVTGKHGLEIKGAPGIARLAAVQSVTLLFTCAGPEVLDETLTVVTDAWGKHSESYNTQVLLGVGVILARYPNIDRDRLTKVLAVDTPRHLRARADIARKSEVEARTQDTKGGSYIARLILAAYNKRLRSDSVLAWIDQPARYYWTEAAEYSRIALQKLAGQTADEAGSEVA